MKSKLVLGLTAALALAALAAFALAQQGPPPTAKQSNSSVEASAKGLVSPTVGETGRPDPIDHGQPHAEPQGRIIGNPSMGTFGLTSAGHSRAFGRWLSPEEASLSQQADKLAQSLGEAKSESEKDQIKGQLSDVLEKQFELRQRRHTDELAELEAHVKKLKGLVQRRQEHRREIIATRLDQIVRDADGLGW